MRHRFFFFYMVIILAICFGSATHLYAKEVSVEASLSHSSFPVDRAARLTITITGSSRTDSIELPEIDNIRLHNRGQSSQFNMINGSISSSLSQNYLIQALEPGDYTLPPITVTAGGQSFTTKPLHFVVTGNQQQNGATAVAPKQSPDEPVFLRISKTADHFPGEIVPITIKAYFGQKYRAESISLPTLQGDGVVMEQLQNNEPHQGQEQVEGKLYSVLTWNTSLSGIKVGEHPISFILDATLLIPQKRKSRSPFGGSSMFGDSMLNDPFFDSFFGGYQRKPISVASPQTTFNVLSLPEENRPENFTGAIGDFDLKVTVSPHSVEVGEPMTLTMEISGQGNFDRVESPLFPEDPRWKTYPPISDSDAPEKDPTKKVFEQAVVARDSGAKEIPSLSFSYFDPDKKEYITRTSSPIAISLKHSAQQAVSQPAAQAAERAQQPPELPTSGPSGLEGLAPIHLETGSFQTEIAPLFKKSWFILLLLSCMVILIGLLGIRIRNLKHAKHPEILTERSRKLQLERELKEVEQAKNTESPTFLALARTTIQNQLGTMWNTPATAISLADLQERLTPDSPLVRIFRAAEDAAYSGAPLSLEKMEEFYAQMKVELEKLL
ncbi:MAG: BatD family protein [Desulforhopalus sp.]